MYKFGTSLQSTGTVANEERTWSYCIHFGFSLKSIYRDFDEGVNFPCACGIKKEMPMHHV